MVSAASRNNPQPSNPCLSVQSGDCLSTARGRREGMRAAALYLHRRRERRAEKLWGLVVAISLIAAGAVVAAGTLAVDGVIP